MYTSSRRLALLSCLGCLLLLARALPARSSDEPRVEPHLAQLVRAAAAFVAAQAQAREEGVVFPEYAEVPAETEAPLYGGSAGVLVFLENAAAVLDDDELRGLADRAASALVAEARETKGGGLTWMSDEPASSSAGLYTGDAGIGHAFLVRARLRDSKRDLKLARRVGDALLERARKDGDGEYWSDSLDIIAGSSGTLLFLLELYEDTRVRKYRDAAVRAGRWLARQGVAARLEDPKAPPQLSWMPRRGEERHYPNFSHGTAGTAYALARVADATGDKICRRAALAGAEWLLAHGKAEAGALRWCHYLPGAEDRFREGWCHGPSGSARLFLLLGDLLDEERYTRAALDSAAWIMRDWPRPGEEGSGTYYYSPSLCCGAAGVLDFFVDLYRLRGDERYREYAVGVAAYLERLGKREGGLLKWTNYDRPDEDGVIYHGVSLMIGTSGEALALLRLAVLDYDEEPVQHLPDRRVRARR